MGYCQNPVARIFKETENDSPSPWGEGRGEGGREHQSRNPTGREGLREAGGDKDSAPHGAGRRAVARDLNTVACGGLLLFLVLAVCEKF